jgi:hypothetical protein
MSVKSCKTYLTVLQNELFYCVCKLCKEAEFSDLILEVVFAFEDLRHNWPAILKLLIYVLPRLLR